jgi:spore germination cell wall hydrolase CwlJ-like protein
MKTIIVFLALACCAVVSPEDATQIDQTEVNCAAFAVFGEARGEPIDGQILVVQVLLNRAEQRGTWVCKEVMRANQITSWRDYKGVPPWKIDESAWLRSRAVARDVISGKTKPEKCQNATHFHALEVSPNWSAQMRDVCVIGNHKYGVLS